LKSAKFFNSHSSIVNDQDKDWGSAD